MPSDGEVERPDDHARQGPRAHNLPGVSRPQSDYASRPLQRLLGVTLVSAPLAEKSERLHTFQVQTSLSPVPAQGTGADLDLRAWLDTRHGSPIGRTS